MGEVPGTSHLHAIRALQKAGFRVVREGKHTVMPDGARIGPEGILIGLAQELRQQTS